MPELAKSVLRRLHAVDPYENFEFARFTPDPFSLGGESLFKEAIALVRPRVIFEVGSWKGGSAITMASHLKEQNVDGVVVCIDTWLGGLEHLLGTAGPDWTIRPYLRNGYPILYYQFLANVVHCGVQDWIVPFPNTSAIAARWLRHENLVADLIYIDGSHDEDDVYRDVTDYWKLLRPGGLMLGDDWEAAWYGVICGVNRFVREKELPLQVVAGRASGRNWAIQKPASA